MQKLMQLAIVVLLGVIATALLNSRSKSEISIPSPPLPQSAGATLPGTQLQPFQTLVPCTIANATNSGTATFPSPSGRLVIQTVSMWRSNVTTGTWAQVYIEPLIGNTYGSYALPFIGDTTISPQPGITLAATIYADPGSTVRLTCERTGTSGTEIDYISVSGYVMSDGAPLVNSGTAQPPAGPPPSSGRPMFTRIPAQ